jgi:expansin (peptidoglycan-binding protein)
MLSGQRGFSGPGGHRRRRPRPRWHLLGLGAGGVAAAVAAVVLITTIGQAAGNRACASVMSGGSVTSGAAAAGGGSQTATHYVLAGLPNCGYSPPADGLFVALPAPEYAGAADCGGYLEVSGPDGSVRVQVIDQCPECAAGHIDLSEAAFARLAPLQAGLINVRYTPLANPALPGPVSVAVKQGSSQYWLALLIDNTGNPLASVQVQTSSGWLSLARASYNYWIAASGAGQGPFTVRLTDTQGHQVTVSGVALNPGAVQSMGTWMYGAGAGSAPAGSAPASSAPASSAPAASLAATSAAARASAATASPAGRTATGARSASVVTSPAGQEPAMAAPPALAVMPAPGALTRPTC